MRKQDSLELKIIRVVLPLLIYFGVTLLVQAAFGCYAMAEKFLEIGKSDTATYILAYQFLDNTNEYIEKNQLLVGFVAALITSIVLGIIIKKDGVNELFREDRDLGPMKMIGIIFMGVFVSTGVGKFVNLLSIDNVLGSNEAVNKAFLSNPLVFQIVTLCIASPIVEELVFRGIMYNRLKQYVDSMAAVFVSAGIFGVYHGNLVQGIYAAILGVLLCFVYERCKSFAAPLLLHMAANVTALVTMYLPISKTIGYSRFLTIAVMIMELTAMCAATYLVYRESGKKEERKNKFDRKV